MITEPPRYQQIAVDPVLTASIVAAVICVLVFHGYETFNYTLSIDEELLLEKVDFFRHIQRGRWGTLALGVAQESGARDALSRRASRFTAPPSCC